MTAVMQRRETEGGAPIPDRLLMTIPGLSEADAQFLAHEAVTIAQGLAPKSTGRSSRNFAPIWGQDFFGIRWVDPYTWYQEIGIRPFTMRALAGKTIPMWIDDPTGEERRKNPRAQIRTTESGKTQVLIFRRAAPIGSRKREVRNRGGRMEEVMVPRSYPGAPGRIEKREAARPWTSEGRVGGRIRRGNVGVRWRHPGLARRGFIRQGLVLAARYHGFTEGAVRDNLGRYR